MEIYRKYSENVLQEVLTEFGQFIRGESPDSLSLTKALNVLDYFILGSDLTFDQRSYYDGLVLESEMRLDLMGALREVEDKKHSISVLLAGVKNSSDDVESRVKALELVSRLGFQAKFMCNSISKAGEHVNLADLIAFIDSRKSSDLLAEW